MTTERTQPEETRQALESRRELATHIAAVIAHPDTPAEIYNAIVEHLSAMGKPGDYTDAETVERILMGHAEGMAELNDADEAG